MADQALASCESLTSWKSFGLWVLNQSEMRLASASMPPMDAGLPPGAGNLCRGTSGHGSRGAVDLARVLLNQEACNVIQEKHAYLLHWTAHRELPSQALQGVYPKPGN